MTASEARVPARPAQKPRLAWHAAPPDEVAHYWTAPLTGLTEAEARERIERIGANKLAEAPPPPWWKRFVAQVSDFTVLALLGAALIAGLLGIWSTGSFLERFGDSIAILAIVVLNAFLGLAQQAKAERALDALREMTAPTARVVRDGRTLDVPAHDLVPGDLILLEDGDRVAADVRLLESHDLEVEEAALTGESVPVVKDPTAMLAEDTPLAERKNMLFMGTRVSKGRARGLVTNTGMHTELGAIAGMLARVTPEATPLEDKLQQFGKQVVIGCIVISAVVFAAGLLFTHQSARDMFLVAVALAVAAIPEGLPAVTTIVLALGTSRMAHRNALVRRLPAVETLGSAQFICTDKTGTLTQNAMSARRVFAGAHTYEVTGNAREVAGQVKPVGEPGDRADVEMTLRACVHAIGAKLHSTDGMIEMTGDPTDGALLTLAYKGGVREHGSIVSERPFTSQRRMASVVVQEGANRRAYVRGAPEALLQRATRIFADGEARALPAEERDQVLREAESWASRALRVVAVAYRDEPGDEPESDLTFVALVGISDPPRPEVKAAIAEAKHAGIRTIMITGDHPATGRAIAEEIGLWDAGAILLTGGEIDSIDQQRLEQQVDRVRVVARATAEHKLRVVEALKARGFVCAMTGDGVNDAPAVKAASIGVAMGRAGTDVTKEAAGLVLADDNYATIIAAVEEGRAIFANIQKFVFFLLSSNAGAVMMVLAAALLGWDAPLAPIQILWINLITNGLPALALGVDPRDPEQMNVPPRAPGGPVLSGMEYIHMVLIGLVMAVCAGWAFYHFRHQPGVPDAEALAQARTVCFAILAYGPLLHAFNCRSKTKSIFKLGLFTNKALWGAVIVGIILETLAIHIPLMRPFFRTGDPGNHGLMWIAIMSVVPLIVGELAKVGYSLVAGGRGAKAPGAGAKAA